jgi:HD superfamily phosphodiesterase
MTVVAEARALADRHLAGQLLRRWRHVQAVAAQAERVADGLGLGDGTLVAAAWLHDIGYGPDLVETGFHPLDGGRYLRRAGVDDRLVRLVAHHSCAVYEARVRGLERELLAEFDREESPTADALVYCDMTTGPSGERVGFVERMDEIERRYGPGHEVTRALELSRPDLTLCCRRTLKRLEGPAAHPM